MFVPNEQLDRWNSIAAGFSLLAISVLLFEQSRTATLRLEPFLACMCHMLPARAGLDNLHHIADDLSDEYPEGMNINAGPILVLTTGLHTLRSRLVWFNQYIAWHLEHSRRMDFLK